jgi:putative peptidoglycan lipid II flippase
MSLIKGFATISLLTLLSRIFGYLRDLAIAFYLGAGLYSDVFVAAFRLPNLFRSILGEGALNSSFIPLFAKKLKNDGKAAAFSLANNLLCYLLLVLLILNGLCLAFMPQVVLLFTPGFISEPHKLKLATEIAYIVFPYIIFASLMAFFGGMLNAFKNFWVFAAAPILLNIVSILFLFFGNDQEGKLVLLAYSTIIAGAAEVAFCFWALFRLGYRFKLVLTPCAEIFTFLRRFIPAIMGSSVGQLNVFISTVIASYIVGGITYLYYADRIFQLPLALLGTAFASVLLPTLSQALADDDKKKLNAIFSKSVQMALILCIAPTVGLMACSDLITYMLFKRGAFTDQDVIKTADALSVMAMSLPFFIVGKILTATYFAFGDTKTPFYSALISLVFNATLSLLLLDSLQHVAVSVGSVIGSIVNLTILLVMLKRKGAIHYSLLNQNNLKLLAAAFSLLILLMLAKLILVTKFGKIAALLIITIAGGAAALIVAHRFKLIKRAKGFDFEL